jgi:hypothetical protein
VSCFVFSFLPQCRCGRSSRLQDSTYSYVAGAEAFNAAAGVLPLSLGNDSFQDIAYDVPELVVFVLEQEHEAGRLGVERRRDVLDELFWP